MLRPRFFLIFCAIFLTTPTLRQVVDQGFRGSTWCLALKKRRRMIQHRLPAFASINGNIQREDAKNAPMR